MWAPTVAPGPQLIIKSIKINNLRNLRSVNIELDPHVNILLGANGAGKTSVLEAIVVLAKGRSFRTGKTASLVGPESDRFQVVATTEHSVHSQQTLGIERSDSGWRARRNGEDVRQLGDLAAHLPLVLIEPNSHQLISGPPEHRRRYIDWSVFHVEHDFLLRWRRYTRAVRQRNAALRNQQRSVAESMNPMLSELGESIHASRQAQFDRMSGLLSETLSELSPGLEDVRIRYRKGWKTESLSTELADALGKDMERGATGPGPHRADMLILHGGKSARERLSRGEQKILAAAMLISQARLMAANGEKPVLLLDDLASEFDESHLTAVMSAGQGLESQMWITGTSSTPYRSLDSGTRAMFHVEHGIITT